MAAVRILCETILPTVKALPACFATIAGCVVAATAPGTNLASALRISAALATPFILVVTTAMRLLEAMGRAMQRPVESIFCFVDLRGRGVLGDLRIFFPKQRCVGGKGLLE